MSALTTASRRRRRRWSFAGACFDEGAWTLTVGGQPVALEAKPLELLHELLLNAGEVVTKDELFDLVWPGVTVVESSLATAISKLRKALGDSDGLIIETVPRIGYRLVAPVGVESLAATVGPRFAFAAGDVVPGRPQWRLQAALGDTGAADVWRARHDKTGELRVFKFADAPDRLRALKREATVARLLGAALGQDGPFAALLEWNFETPPYFIESRDGGLSLTAWAATQGGLAAVPAMRRLAIARAAAHAVAAVHAVGVLHKDLKPANMLIAEDGADFRLRLADFGSGQVVNDELLAAHAITNLGGGDDVHDDSRSSTLFYRAPEVAAGALPTLKSDVYALGMTVFQLVVGDFGRGLAPGWESAIDDPLLRQDIAEASRGDPADRLASAAELADRLDRLDERRAAAAVRAAADAAAAELHQREDRRAARRPWVRAAAAAVIAGLVGTSLAATVATRERDEAQRQTAIATASYGFLADDLLARADPTKSDSAAETLIDAVKRGSAEIDRRFVGAPLVAGRLHHALARAFDQRGDYIAARAEYAAARKAYGAAGLDATDEVTVMRLQQASMDALSTQADALARARAVVTEVRAGKTDAEAGEVGVWLASTEGMIALAGEDVPRARERYAYAATLAGALPERFDERQRLNMRQRAGFTLLRLGDGAGAERELRPVALGLARLRGPDSPDTLLLRLNLAQALLVQKHHAAAIAELTSLLPRFESRFGPDHRHTLLVLAARQQSLGALERYAESAADGERVWRTAAARDGPETFTAVAGRIDTAVSECRAGDTAAGIANARAAYAAARQAPGPETALAQAVRSSLADCLIIAGRPREAAPLLEGIDRRKVAELVGDANWGAMLDLARAETAFAMDDRTTAARLFSSAAPGLPDTAADPYTARRAAKLAAQLRPMTQS